MRWPWLIFLTNIFIVQNFLYNVLYHKKENEEKSHTRIQSFLLILFVLLTACGNSSNAQLKECFDLGQKYLAEMNYEEAIIAYNKALEIDPKNVEAYQVFANIYEFQEDMNKAKSTIERALVAVPSNSEIQSRYEKMMLITASNVDAVQAGLYSGTDVEL